MVFLAVLSPDFQKLLDFFKSHVYRDHGQGRKGVQVAKLKNVDATLTCQGTSCSGKSKDLISFLAHLKSSFGKRAISFVSFSWM